MFNYSLHKGYRLFFKHCLSTQTAELFAPDELMYGKLFMGSAKTRNPLKRVDLNFEFIKLNFVC